ncbi:Pol Polyprotein [Phytophthora megakarya]|uniref:Pol Polyprotein n=1 Tax=Phytophthora megakarya TaxID=4795 RepID=A0A225UJF5_9STRA|nr:Pol Polyprotein [Phytophthora megakarya]
MDALGFVLNFKEKIVQWDGYASTLNTGPPSEAPTPTVATDHEFPDEYKETVDTAVRPTDLMPETVSGEVAARYLKLLEDYAHLYDKHLGRMRFDDYVLHLSPDFKPVNAKPYAIPRSVEDKAKAAIQRLVNQEVLEQIYGSEMASPAFFLVKQNGTLRLLIDFRVLNKYLRRSPYYARYARSSCDSLVQSVYLRSMRTWATMHVDSPNRVTHTLHSACLGANFRTRGFPWVFPLPQMSTKRIWRKSSVTWSLL